MYQSSFYDDDGVDYEHDSDNENAITHYADSNCAYNSFSVRV